jgi:hypothetical protein
VTRLATSCQTCERVAEPSPGPAVLHRWQTGLSSRALKCAERLPPSLGSHPELSASEIACSLSVVSEMTKLICRAAVGQLGTRDRGSDLLDNGPARRGGRHFQPCSSVEAVPPTGRCLLETVGANRLDQMPLSGDRSEVKVLPTEPAEG